MSTHNIGFSEEMAKIIFQLSVNMHFRTRLDSVALPFSSSVMETWCFG